MKKLLLFMVAIAAFSACSSDDSANNVDVTGVWREVAYQDTETGEWHDLNCNDNIYAQMYNFSPNGVVNRSYYCTEDNFVGTGSYVVQGDVLTVTSSGESFTYKISTEGTTTLYMQFYYPVSGENVYDSKIRLVRE